MSGAVLVSLALAGGFSEPEPMVGRWETIVERFDQVTIHELDLRRVDGKVIGMLTSADFGARHSVIPNDAPVVLEPADTGRFVVRLTSRPHPAYGWAEEDHERDYWVRTVNPGDVVGTLRELASGVAYEFECTVKPVCGEDEIDANTGRPSGGVMVRSPMCADCESVGYSAGIHLRLAREFARPSSTRDVMGQLTVGKEKWILAAKRTQADEAPIVLLASVGTRWPNNVLYSSEPTVGMLTISRSPRRVTLRARRDVCKAIPSLGAMCSKRGVTWRW